MSRRPTLTSRTAVLGLVAGALLLLLALPVRSWVEQRNEIAALDAAVSAQRDRVAALQHEQARWADPAYVAAQARQRLHFVQPGEVGYVVLDPQVVTPAASPTVGAAVTSADGPWYAALWDSAKRAAGEQPAVTPSPTVKPPVRPDAPR